MDHAQLPQFVMALGFFDGVHLGHKEVMMKTKEYATETGLTSAVMTFDPHPSVVLGKNIKHVKYITPVEEKITLVENLGIDYLFIVHFTPEFAQLLPQQFVDQYIIGLNVKHVVFGYDYTYGRMGKGTTETMPFHARNQFTQTIVPKLASEGSEKVSSTWIRSIINEGKTEEVPRLLGRFYTIRGTVVHGDNRGKSLGFPTANIKVDDDYLTPSIGVYAVRVKVKGTIYSGICNVGYVPTFNKDKNRLTIEVHLFDFNEDIYGQTVIIEWHLRLRKEKKFSDVEQLVEQISKDKQKGIDYFNNSVLEDF